MRSLLLLTAALVSIGAAPAKKLLTPTDIVNGAPAAAWKTIPADDLLVMALSSFLGQPLSTGGGQQGE